MLVNVLLESCRRFPDKIAVDDGASALTYKRLTLLASVLRDVIRRESACPRIGIMLPASSVFPATLFGALWASRVAVPLNFLLAPDELTKVVEDAGLDLIVTTRRLDKISSALPAKSIFLEELSLKRKAMFAMIRRRPAPPKVDPGDTAVILYTSGTTAEPKGVELTQSNLYRNAFDAIHSLDMDAEQRFLNVLPPFHVFGLTGGVIVPIVAGASVFAIPRFSSLAVMKAVPAKQITVMMAIPSMYAAMLKSKSGLAETFRSVTLAMSGGEPLPDSVRTGFEERFGVTLRQGYGLTETSPIVAACSARNHRVGTVGRPIRNTDVRLIDSDGHSVSVNRDGEILVRGPGVMKGYYRKPEETKRVIDSDGWFHTGDIGRLDEDGYLAITGRMKEMLIIGGENVFPREIESVLESYEGVLQAAVIGVPDDLRGEAPVAFVIAAEGAEVSEQALRNHAKGLLAGFKVPKRIVIRDDLPTGPTGKILKRHLTPP